jgi:hypothetical protein
VPESQPAVLAQPEARTPGPRGWSVAACRPDLIDAALVRAEFARLRAPRPQTEIHAAHAVSSTIAARA